MSPTHPQPSDRTRGPVPIDLGNDPLIRLRNLLILLAQSILKIFPNIVVLLFSLFLAALAILAFFFRVIVPPRIFQRSKATTPPPTTPVP